jgi:hypothetical protein
MEENKSAILLTKDKISEKSFQIIREDNFTAFQIKGLKNGNFNQILNQLFFNNHKNIKFKYSILVKMMK